jgi:gluconate 2-dehydrogenase gamma chain
MEETLMSKHDEARRAFLVGAAVVGAGAALAPEALAQQQPAATNTAAPGHDHGAGNGSGYGASLNVDESAAVKAFAERLMPGAPGKPGATDANVLNYIDLALAGAYADQQDFYRRGLAQLDAWCLKAYGKSFVKLTAAQQDEVIGALEQGKAGGFEYPAAQAFFNTLRTHTMEGMFADPAYGGNRNFAGWQLVGFPGAQLFYTGADLASTDAFTRAPLTGLQAQAKPDQSKPVAKKA